MDTIKQQDKKTILIIEDSESDRFAYRRYLQSGKNCFYEILEAESLEMGLEIWNRQSPDLVLLDINLPDGNGLELLEIIQQNYPDGKSPVVTLIGLEDQRVAVQAMKLGARDCLIKEDITATALCRSVGNAITELTLSRKLARSQQQEAFLARIALHIHQFLTLEELYRVIVTEVQVFLKSDRVLIYQLNDNRSGQIVAEAVIPPWESFLHTEIIDTCFQKNESNISFHGKTFVIQDIEEANLSDCHLELLERFQVKANLAVPIFLPTVLGEQKVPWGLLIAHQCSGPRSWQEADLDLLQRLSVQLAIALQQSIAYQQLQQELTQRQRVEQELKQLNQLLETKITEQTQEIRESQQFVRTLLDTLPVYVFWKNRKSVFLGCNQPLAELMGLSSPDEFVNTTGLEFSYTEEELLLYQADDREVMATGQSKRMIEETMTLPNGKTIWIETHKSPLRDHTGTVIGIVGVFQDISDRKRTEEALQLSEERFRNAFENTPVGMSLVSLEGNIIRSNNAICNFLNYSETELINLHFREITHPDDLHNSVNFIAKILAGEIKTHYLEKRYLTKKKQVVWGLVSVSLIRDKQSNPLHFVVQIQDITARKQAEEALHNERLRLQLALDASKMGTWSRRLDSDQLVWSERSQKIFGFQPGNFPGNHQTFLAMIHPEDLAQVLQSIDHTFETGESYHLEYRIIRLDGEVRWISVLGMIPEMLTLGERQLIGVMSDISDRKQAEISLRESKQFVQAIIDTVPLPLFWKNQESVFLGCNQQLARILGLDSAQQIIGKTDFDLSLTLEQANLYQAGDRRVISSGQAELGVEETHLLPTGEQQWIETHKAPLRDGENRIIGVVGMFQDITERKNYEVQLQQKNTELEKLLRLREDMSNMIVHDLRNPLSNIVFSTNLLSHYLNKGSDIAILSKKIEQILGSSKRLQNMIDSLLLMAKLESGKILLNPVETDLHILGTMIINDFELMANSCDIQLQSQLPEPGRNISVDEVILRRVIDNLISNALKFSPPGSQVSLNIKYLAKDRFRVSVVDNGPGISKEKQQKIFEKFEIGTVKQNVSQIGLGLAFCKMAVEAQGGTLAIAPNQPQGSIFTVEI